MQSADLVFDPINTGLRLMLVRQRGVRQWTRKRVPRRPTISPEAPIEVTYEWRSWHEGDGLSRIRDPKPGLQPPRTSYGTCTTLYPGKIMPGMKNDTVSLATNPFAGGIGGVRAAFGYNGDAYVAGKNSIRLTYNSLTDAWTVAGTQVLDATFSATSSVEWNGTRYIALENGRAWKITAGPTYTQSPIGAAYQWSLVQTIGTRFYFTTASASPSLKFVTVTGDPFNSATHSGGTSLAPFTVSSINQLGRAIYFMTDKGIGFLDTELNIVLPVPEVSSTNQSYSTYSWHGGLLIPAHTVLWYTEGLVAQVGIDSDVVNEYSAFNSRFAALIVDPVYVYGVTFTNKVMMGRERTSADGPGSPFIWYHISDFGPNPTVTAHPSIGLTNGFVSTRRFLIIPENDSNNVRFVHVPSTQSGTAYLDDTFFFTTSNSEKVLPRMYLGQPGTVATLKSVELDLENADASNSVQIAYDLNNTGSFTNLGSTVTANGRTEVTFPAGTNAREIQLRVTLTHSAGAPPVIVRRIALNVAERPLKTSLITAVCRLGPGIADRNGSEMDDDPDVLLTTLYSYETAGTTVSLLDPIGRTINVLVLAVDDSEEEDQDESSAPKRLVTLTMQEV